MAYTQVTLVSATEQLAARLSDPNNVHWSATELGNALIESCRIFQSLTGFYRRRATFNTVVGQNFYDLRITNPTEYAFTVTDNQLLAEIQAHLYEPVSNPWTGTLQFSVDVIAAAIQRARNQYLTDTGIYVTRTSIGPITPTTGRVVIANTILDIRRAAWQDETTLLTYGLSRTDEYSALAYRPNWPVEPNLPDSFSVAVTTPVSLQLIPPLSTSGFLDLCIVSSGPSLPCDPVDPIVIGIPDDYSWATKYGALADLLAEDGPANDQARSDYCRQLYNLGMSVGKSPVTTMQAVMFGVLAQPGSIEDFDRYRPGWQNATATVPPDILQVSPNLLAMSTPDGAYEVQLDMAVSIPPPNPPAIPYLPIGLDLLDAILDMAQHIASIKLAGSELSDTLPLRDNFLRLAALGNSRLRANIHYNTLLNQPAIRQDREVQRLAEPVIGARP